MLAGDIAKLAPAGAARFHKSTPSALLASASGDAFAGIGTGTGGVSLALLDAEADATALGTGAASTTLAGEAVRHAIIANATTTMGRSTPKTT